jgi:hypothetical protein
MKFKINTPNVVHELIDDEVIIVNLKKGDYYSLLSASAEIWIEIERGQSSAQIVAQLTQNYQEESEIIAQGVQLFIGIYPAISKIKIEIICKSQRQILPFNYAVMCLPLTK